MRNTLIAILLLVASIASAQTDPSTLPLVQQSGLQYLGAFRLPTETVNGDNFTSAGKSMTFNPETNTIYISSYRGVGEVIVPTPVNSAVIGDLPYATLVQPFGDPAEGHIGLDMPGSGPTGLMIYGNRIYGTATIWYDANITQRISHFSHSLRPSETGTFSGWSAVWQPENAAYVSGFMATVPSEWQAKLGGPALTGQCCVSIVSRTSNGPAAFSFDPAKVGQPIVSANPLVYYTTTHSTLGPWEGSNPTWGATSYIRGMAVIGGTRSLMYFGNNGLGSYCYGNGTSDPSLGGTQAPDGSHWCYDPTNAGKGQHAYPYRYQVWAYDLNDLAAVKAGAKQPWDVVPYGVWPITLPTTPLQVELGGVAYDAAKQIIYVAQLHGDYNQIIADAPIIHAFKVTSAPLVDPPPPPPPPPPNEDPVVVALQAKLSEIKTAAEAALARISTLKPNSRPPSYVIDALKKAAGQ